jgi:hypothetical protein
MAKWEIKNLFQLPSGRYLPCGLNIVQQLWWRFMPGVVVNVKWPVGLAEINESMPQWDWTIGPSRYFVESADPNEHYRPYMEKYIGKQGWDWNWGVANDDVAANRLTIKIRQKHAKYATILALRWS